MGKRSDFERVERDYYQTPLAAVKPLAPFLPQRAFTFAEPCAGDGRLVKHLEVVTGGNALCELQCDLEPDAPHVKKANALDLEDDDFWGAELIITNPPWDRRKATGNTLHRMIDHFTALRPTWLLFDSDWMQTVQAAPFMDRLVACVSIGRVKWIEDSNMSGKDNCQFYLFHKDARELTEAPLFFGRNAKPPKGFADRYTRAVETVLRPCS